MASELNFASRKCDDKDLKQIKRRWHHFMVPIKHLYNSHGIALNNFTLNLWWLPLPPLTPQHCVCLFLCGCLLFFNSPLVRRTLLQETKNKLLFYTGVAMASGKESGGLDNLAFDVSTMTYSCIIYHMKTFLSILSKRSQHHQAPVSIQKERCFWFHISLKIAHWVQINPAALWARDSF